MKEGSDNAGSSKPVRVRIRFATVQDFTEKFAQHVTRAGVFIPTSKPAALETRVRFDVVLHDGTPVCAADGKVAWLQGPGTDEPAKRQGMGLKFTRLEGRARELIYGMLRDKGIAGDAPPSPVPSDDDEPTTPVGAEQVDAATQAEEEEEEEDTTLKADKRELRAAAERGGEASDEEGDEETTVKADEEEVKAVAAAAAPPPSAGSAPKPPPRKLAPKPLGLRPPERKATALGVPQRGLPPSLPKKPAPAPESPPSPPPAASPSPPPAASPSPPPAASPSPPPAASPSPPPAASPPPGPALGPDALAPAAAAERRSLFSRGRGKAIVAIVVAAILGSSAVLVALMMMRAGIFAEAREGDGAAQFILVQGNVVAEGGDTKVVTALGDGGGPANAGDAGSAPAGDSSTASPRDGSTRPEEEAADGAEGPPREDADPRRLSPADEEIYARNFERRRTAVAACFERHAPEGGGAPQIWLDLSIDRTGAVQNVVIQPAEMRGTELGGCVVDVARATRFGPHARPVEVRIPIHARRVE